MLDTFSSLAPTLIQHPRDFYAPQRVFFGWAVWFFFVFFFMKTSSFFIMNPTNQNQGGHSQSQRSFTFGPIDLEMLNADASSAGVPAQTHNEAGRASNSAGNSVSKCFIKSQDILTFNSKLSTSGTIPPVHPQAPTSFPPISVHPGGSYIPPGSFPAGLLPVNSYLLPDVPPLSRPPPIGAFSAGPPHQVYKQISLYQAC